MAAAPAAIVRPLSGFERQFWAWGRIGGMNAGLVARLRGDVDPAALLHALRTVQRRHALLRARIVHRQGPHWAEGAPPVPLQVLRREDDGHALRVAQEHLDRFFPDEGCLWQVHLLEGRGVHDLVLVMHHATADALGEVQVLRDLLAALAGQALPPVPPAMGHEALLPAGTKAPAKAVSMARFLLLLAAKRPLRVPWERDVPPVRRRTRVLPATLDEASTAALIARTKAERASVNGVLAAAVLQAVAMEVQPGRAPTVGWASQVDFRGMLQGLPPQAVGCYAFGLPFFHRAGEGIAFWDLAREAAGSVDAAVQRRAPLRAIAGLAGAPRTVAGASQRLERLGRLSPLAAGVSNIGRIPDLPATPGLQVEDVRILTSLGVAGAGVSLVGSTYRGRMALELIHPWPLVGDERARRIADRAFGLLREAGG